MKVPYLKDMTVMPIKLIDPIKLIYLKKVFTVNLFVLLPPVPMSRNNFFAFSKKRLKKICCRVSTLHYFKCK